MGFVFITNIAPNPEINVLSLHTDYLSPCPLFGKRGNITYNSAKLSNIQILL